jgi:peroxiredoxin
MNRNIKVISLSADTVNQLRKFYEENGFDFTMISDRSLTIVREYNVQLTRDDPEFDKFQVEHATPSQFLINREGIIVWQHIDTKMDRGTVKMLIDAIEQKI